jgi:cation diffusion facilitator CzcD-associated flavoprotein CzcO
MEEFVNKPKAYFDFRLKLEKQLAATFKGLWTNSQTAEDFTSRARNHMSQKINDPQTLEALLPTEYKAGCRRFTPADKYMEALNQPHINVVASPIDHVAGRAIYSRDGRRREYDAVVCGTGFEPYKPRFPIVGRNGVDLAEKWSDTGNYESYLAATVAEFPNFFGKSSSPIHSV